MTIAPSYFQKQLEHDINVLCVKDVAEFLKKSSSWVYKNFKELGGVKVGGALLFPSKEKIYERLFQPNSELVAVPVPVSKTILHQSRVQDEKGSPGSRSRKKKGGKKSETADDPNRHGLLGPVKSTS